MNRKQHRERLQERLHALEAETRALKGEYDRLGDRIVRLRATLDEVAREEGAQ